MSVSDVDTSDSQHDSNQIFHTLHFVIDIKVKLMTRKRDSTWDLLSDIGGLHDGVILCFGYFVSPLISTLFHVDTLQRTMIAKKE